MSKNKFLFSALRMLYFFQVCLISCVSFADKIDIIEQQINIPDDISIYDQNEVEHTLDEFEGKVTLLVFWATWCADCIKEMPSLDELQKDLRKLPFKIVAASQDFHGVGDLKKYFKAQNIKYIDLYYDHKNKLFKSLSVGGLPTAFLIDTEGKMIVKFSGTTDWSDEKIRNLILSYMPGAPVILKGDNQAPIAKNKFKM